MFTARSSSVRKFERCQRRWWYSERTPEPTTDALTIGTEVHKVLEEWLTKGTPPPATKAGLIARRGLHLLPPPSSNLRVEVTNILDVAPGIQFRRTIDLFDPIEPRLYDHKTYSQSKYIPTPEQLKEDVQCSSYAWYAMELAGAGTLEATWVYYPKLAGAATPVHLTFHRHELADRWGRTVASIKKMADLLDKPSNACDTNFEACNDYGRQCLFYNQCRGKTMGLDLMSKMKKNLPITDTPVVPTLLERQLTASILPPDAPPDNLAALPAAEEPKKTRAKRTTKAEQLEAVDQVVALANATFPGSVVVTGPTKEQSQAMLDAITAQAPGLELWIGAMRDGAHHVKLDTLAGPVADKVAEDNGVGHFGLIDYTKGSAMLAAKFGEYIEQYPPFVPVFVDRVPSAIGKACLEVLVRRATTILRGV